MGLSVLFAPFPSRLLFYLFLDILYIVFLQFLSSADLNTYKDKNVKILGAKIHSIYMKCFSSVMHLDDGMRKVWDRFSLGEHKNSLRFTPVTKTITYFFTH